MKRINITFRVLIVLLSLSLVLASCKKEQATLPPVTTAEAVSSSEPVSDSSCEDTNAPDDSVSDPYQIIEVPKPEVDPYLTVSKEEFYSNYEPATDYWDAYYRTQHGFMSGCVDDQDQNPTIAEDRPREDGVYLRNSFSLYSYDGNAYTVLDSEGNVSFTVFKGGAYVTLEEVAAYVFAFGDIPVNYTSAKKGSPSSSVWGKYLRLNHSAFSGSTSKYPYEPELPDISGCGGSLYYYEIDIGTTGTDCDPSYVSYTYNDGNKITRGAARIVYSRFDANHNNIIDVNEKYLFYTNNHYNDFREYLNYKGGWGEIFGNITGGGTISSKYNYNPTPYIKVEFKDFRDFAASGAVTVDIYFWFDSSKSKFHL
jgi:hypothetical protein